VHAHVDKTTSLISVPIIMYTQVVHTKESSEGLPTLQIIIVHTKEASAGFISLQIILTYKEQ
jgi:hypothetical protein